VTSLQMSMENWLRVLAVAEACGFCPSAAKTRPLISEMSVRGHDPVSVRWIQQWFPSIRFEPDEAEELKMKLSDFRKSGDILAVFLRDSVFRGNQVYMQVFFRWLTSSECPQSIDTIIRLPSGAIVATFGDKGIRIEVVS